MWIFIFIAFVAGMYFGIAVMCLLQGEHNRDRRKKGESYEKADSNDRT